MTEQQLQDTRKQIAGILKRKRNELNLSQDELAERTGLGIATIKRAESAKFWLGLKQFIVILDVLNSKIEIK